MAEEIHIEQMNRFAVGTAGRKLIVGLFYTGQLLNLDEALNLAVWLVAMTELQAEEAGLSSPREMFLKMLDVITKG